MFINSSDDNDNGQTTNSFILYIVVKRAQNICTYNVSNIFLGWKRHFNRSSLDWIVLSTQTSSSCWKIHTIHNNNNNNRKWLWNIKSTELNRTIVPLNWFQLLRVTVHFHIYSSIRYIVCHLMNVEWVCLILVFVFFFFGNLTNNLPRMQTVILRFIETKRSLNNELKFEVYDDRIKLKPIILVAHH